MISIKERKRIKSLIQQEQPAPAVERLLKVKLLQPSDAAFVHRCAASIFASSDFRASLPLYQLLVEYNPMDADALFACSRMQHITPDNPLISALTTATQHQQKMSHAHAIKLAYTLGKVHQDMGNSEQAYSAFAAGAQMHAQAHPFDAKSNFALMADVITTLTKERLASLALTQEHIKRATPTPIFILGMPRSGSTLVEQILVSHSKVAAAGEVKYLQNAVQKFLIGEHKTLAAAAPTWTTDDFRSCAQYYLELLSTHRTKEGYVIDKLPGNFLFVGLIRALFPNAIVVHTIRNPYACLWSNFSTLFGDGMLFTYDLDLLGAYYRRYQQVMSHWRDQYPEAIMDTDYEQLVTRGDAAIRELVENVGLPWDTACLNFHETSRSIRTASVAQVQTPLYKKSVDSWRQYRAQLEPALRPHLPST